MTSRGTQQFRDIFDFQLHRKVVHWFPFHMHHGIKAMQAKLKSVDVILEVHDARVPFSGRSSLLMKKLSIRPHFLLLNKMDLADLSRKPDIIERLEREGNKRVMFTNFKNFKPGDVKGLLHKIITVATNSNRYHREHLDEFQVMVIGVPNTGKSSLLNAFGNVCVGRSKLAKVGNLPGVTRSVMTRVKISDLPLIYILDTPGIYEPYVTSVETGFRLAACGTLQDHKVGIITLADFVLFSLNQMKLYNYVHRFDLKAPTDDILAVLTSIASHKKRFKEVRLGDGHKKRFLDVDSAGVEFLGAFRKGLLGKVFLDTDYLATPDDELSSTSVDFS